MFFTIVNLITRVSDSIFDYKRRWKSFFLQFDSQLLNVIFLYIPIEYQPIFFSLLTQTKLHENECDMRTRATIATHNATDLKFPLVFKASSTEHTKILALGREKVSSAASLIQKLKEERDALKLKKKRQPKTGLYKWDYYRMFSKYWFLLQVQQQTILSNDYDNNVKLFHLKNQWNLSSSFNQIKKKRLLKLTLFFYIFFLTSLAYL